MSTTAIATARTAPAVERTLRLAQTVSSVGDGVFIVTSALFLVRVVGLTPVAVGLGLTVGWALGFAASAPLGRVADRVGLRPTAVALAMTTAAGLVGLVAASGMAGFVVAVAVYAVSQTASSSVRQALVVRLVEATRRVEVRARMQVGQNAGIGVGAGIGGVALVVDRPAVFVAVLLLDAAAFAVTGLLLTRLPAVPGTVPRPDSARRGVLRDRRFLAVTALNGVLMLYMPMLSVVMPLWIARRTAAPTWMIAALFVLNTLGVVLLQVRAARRVHDLRAAAGSVRVAGLLLLASTVAFSCSGLVAGAVPAALVLTGAALLQLLGEVRLAAGAWEIAFGLGDPERPGAYQGVFGLGVPLARTVGPLALTVLVVDGGVPGWWALGLLFAAAATAIAVIVRAAGASS